MQLHRKRAWASKAQHLFGRQGSFASSPGREVGPLLAGQAAAIDLLVRGGPGRRIGKGAHLLQRAVHVAIWIWQRRIPAHLWPFNGRNTVCRELMHTIFLQKG